MNRIEEKMQELQAEGKKAFITYMTAGLPDLDTTAKILKAEEAAGLDVCEVGIPFSDPIADGPVIQDASYRAILNGTNLTQILEMMEKLRAEGMKMPIVFMMYYNTVFSMGLENFVKACVKAGVDGLIIPDLPKEEQQPLQSVLDEEEGAPILIQLVSPISADRVPYLLEGARGFVYCVSSMGVTGKNVNFGKQIHDYLSSVKAVSKIPVMMGFGIKTAEDVLPLKDALDGAIVGSHFIRLMDENNFAPEVAGEYVKTFKEKLNND